jgi:DNA processing protein
MQNELLYQIALTLVPNIGDVRAKALINHFGEASSIFQASKKAFESIEGFSPKSSELYFAVQRF